MWVSSGCYLETLPWSRELHARLVSERSGVQIPVNCLSQINFELDIVLQLAL
jgi:hypothetical protein